MTGLWPWLAVAGAGALHGLNPASGWMFAAARGLRAGDPAQALRTLTPLAVGHTASVALVAAAVALGIMADRAVMRAVAVGLFVSIVLIHLLRRNARHERAPAMRAGSIGLMLWSLVMSTAHGAGLMLVPALIPVCMADTPAREITASGSLTLALAALGVHAAAMLAVIAVIACGICRGSQAVIGAHPRRAGTGNQGRSATVDASADEQSARSFKGLYGRTTAIRSF